MVCVFFVFVLLDGKFGKYRCGHIEEREAQVGGEENPERTVKNRPSAFSPNSKMYI